MKKLLRKQGFTLVELIIVIAIIAVLSVAAFMMLTKWLSNSRDSERLGDLSTINKALSIHLLDLDNTSGLLPYPDGYISIKFDETTTWNQGILGQTGVSLLGNLDKIPVDPFGKYYTYSTTLNRKKYQIAAKLEKNTAFLGLNSVYAEEGVNEVVGNFDPALYKLSLSGTTDCGLLYLPSIVVVSGINDMTLGGDDQYFVLDESTNNLLYGGTVLVTYRDLVNVNENLNTVWSGLCNTHFTETIIQEIGENLSGMVELPTESEAATEEVKKMIKIGGIDLDEQLEDGLESTSCAENPGYINAIYTEGIPSIIDETWQDDDNGAACYYECTGGYAGDDCTLYNVPPSITFTDDDANPNELKGTIKVGELADETYMTDYVIYWGSDATTKLSGQGPIATIPKTQRPRYILEQNTQIPSGATYFIAFAKNGEVEMSIGVSSPIVDEDSCDYNNMTVYNLNPGDTIPAIIENGHQYNLSAGDYEIDTRVVLESCSILSGDGNVNILVGSGTYYESLIKLNGNDITLSGLKISGTEANPTSEGCIYSRNSMYTYIQDITVSNCVYGIQLGGGSNSILNNIVSFDNSIGIYVSMYGLGKFNNINSYNNYSGIKIRRTKNNKFNNLKLFNNSNGIFLSDAKYNSFNNTQLFNNDYGIYIINSNSSFGSSVSNRYSNFNVYNNETGILMKSNSDRFQNIYYYNNSLYGIYKSIPSGKSNEYYGFFVGFDNNTQIYGNGRLYRGTDTYAERYGFPAGGGYTSTGLNESFDISWTTRPDISGWDYTKIGIQCKVGEGCDNENLTGSFTGNETYTYGNNILKQYVTLFDYFPYNSSKFIGQW